VKGINSHESVDSRRMRNSRGKILWLTGEMLVFYGMLFCHKEA
jgi:hypothetical protein